MNKWAGMKNGWTTGNPSKAKSSNWVFFVAKGETLMNVHTRLRNIER